MKGFTESKDGLPRMTIKMEARLSLWEMSVLYAYSIKHSIPYLMSEDSIESHRIKVMQFVHKDMNNKSKSAILDSIRDSILVSGTENPHYAVADDKSLDLAVVFVQDYLAKKFGYSHVEISEAK